MSYFMSDKDSLTISNMFPMKAIIHWAKEASLMTQVLEYTVVAEQSTCVPWGLSHHNAVIRPDTVVLEK
jgi:hypothetical protein